MIYLNCGFMPVIPFFGTTQAYYTGQPNAALWSMNPGRLCGDFAGRIQFSTYPTDYTWQDIARCNRASDISYYNNYFLNTFLSTLNQNSYIARQQQQINKEAYQIGTNVGESIALASSINATGNSVASLKYQLEQDLKNSQLAEEQKKEFEAMKKKVEDLEARIEQVIKDKESGAKTTEQLQEELKNINSENIAIINKRNELVKKLNGAAASGTGGTEDSENTEGAGTVDDENGENGTGAVEQPQKEKLTYHHGLSFRDENMYAADVKDEHIALMASTLYDCINGAWDNDKRIAEFLSANINKDNVEDFVLYWNQHYSDKFKSDDKYGLIESIMDEYSLTNSNCAVNPIFIAMQDHLADLERKHGKDNPKVKDARMALEQMKDEKDAFWRSTKKTAQYFNKAHKAMIELRMENEK